MENQTAIIEPPDDELGIYSEDGSLYDLERLFVGVTILSIFWRMRKLGGWPSGKNGF